MNGGTVRHNDSRITEAEYRRLSAASIRRLSAADGPGKLALAAGCDAKTLSNARDERSSLGGATLFNLLATDPTALDELLLHFGLRAVPIDAAGKDDARLNANVAALSAEIAAAMVDGRIDHAENARIVKAARPVVQELTGRIAAAGRAA